MATVRILRSTTAGNTPSSLVSGQIAINEADARLYYRTSGGAVAPLPSIVSYATTASFPATGVAGLLFLASDTSKLYRWESTVYVEVGAIATSTSASDLLSGTLPDARLSATVTAALTDARTPTDGSVTTAKIADAAVTDAKIAAVAATKLTGTLADARLSSNVVTNAAFLSRLSMPTTAIETFPRMAVSFLAMTNGNVLYSFFTPLTTVTVSQVTMLSGGTAAAGLTLARMGLVTYDEATGTATLVAQTASDTTLFAATRTAYTRSFSTAGGFPATYTLNAGTRYGVALLCIGTTIPTIQGNNGLAEMSALTPRLSAIRTSQSDLSTITATGAQSQVLYARFS